MPPYLQETTVKPMFYAVLLACAAGLWVVPSSSVHAARTKTRAQVAAVHVAPISSVSDCSNTMGQDAPSMEAFAELAVDEPGFAYHAASQYDKTRGFSCFVSAETTRTAEDQSVRAWLASTRLLSAFPLMESTFFLPAGLHWIGFE